MEIDAEIRILGWGSERFRFSMPGGPHRLWDIIRFKTEQEWEAYEKGTRCHLLRECLPPERLNSAEAVPSALEEAHRMALDGYRSGWYIVLVDGEAPGGLDVTVDVHPQTSLAIVRLYPLPDSLSHPP